MDDFSSFIYTYLGNVPFFKSPKNRQLDVTRLNKMKLANVFVKLEPIEPRASEEGPKTKARKLKSWMIEVQQQYM